MGLTGLGFDTLNMKRLNIFLLLLYYVYGISEKILSHDTCHSTLLFVGHPWPRDEMKMETAGSD